MAQNFEISRAYSGGLAQLSGSTHYHSPTFTATTIPNYTPAVYCNAATVTSSGADE